MKNPAKDLLEFAAKITANLLILRIMSVGFVWIWISWPVALLTACVWLLCEKLLAEGYYNAWVAEIGEHIKNHHDENCKDCSDDGT